MIGAHARGSCVEGARELFLDKLLRVKLKIHVLLVLLVQTVILGCSKLIYGKITPLFKTTGFTKMFGWLFRI